VRHVLLIVKDAAVRKEAGVWHAILREGQALRLMFTEPPPRIVQLEREYKVKVCIGSEFGLWDRRHMQSEERQVSSVYIKCTANFIGGQSCDGIFHLFCEDRELGGDGKVIITYYRHIKRCCSHSMHMLIFTTTTRLP